MKLECVGRAEIESETAADVLSWIISSRRDTEAETVLMDGIAAANMVVWKP